MTQILCRITDSGRFRTTELFKGDILPMRPWDDYYTLALTTGLSYFPVRVIPKKDIISIDGKEQNDVSLKEIERESFIVTGSTGTRYLVKRVNDVWSCECKGYQFRYSCKHIKQMKEKTQCIL